MTRSSKLVSSILALLVVLLIPETRAATEDHPATYPNMAPLDQYLTADRNAEITLARSAAPKSISDNAKILVLGRNGYETAAEGTNGFVCVVERSWMSPFDSPEFWNPKMRGPICFNPPAARCILPITHRRTELVLAGKSKTQMLEDTKEAFEKKELPALEPGAMAYMMSKAAYLTDADDHNVAHLMLYAPPIDGAVWGADLPGSPVMLIPQFRGVLPIDVFIVPVGRWSDGTAAPVM
jgi:hypothetical protein